MYRQESEMNEKQYKAEIQRLEDLLYIIITKNVSSLPHSDSQYLELVKARGRVRELQKEMATAEKNLQKIEGSHNEVLAAKFPTVKEWLEEAELGVRPYNSLKAEFTGEGQTVIDVAMYTKAEMLKISNVGRRSLFEIEEALAKYGLHPGMEREEAECAFKRK